MSMTRTANTRRFTEQMVERLSPPASGRTEIGDDICPGLLLRVTERGVRSFSVIYKVVGEGGVSASGRLLKGKQRRLTLGQWPTVNLVEARERARDIMVAALNGNDPRDERRAQNLLRAADTFENVTERFIRLHAKPNVKSWKNVQRVLDLHVLRDAVLGHAKPGLQKTYNKHDYLEEKRAALDAHTEHLLEVFE